eukprot:1156219-Pelagomonas_calceolata.AAC.5
MIGAERMARQLLIGTIGVCCIALNSDCEGSRAGRMRWHDGCGKCRIGSWHPRGHNNPHWSSLIDCGHSHPVGHRNHAVRADRSPYPLQHPPQPIYGNESGRTRVRSGASGPSTPSEWESSIQLTLGAEPTNALPKWLLLCSTTASEIKI